MTDTPETESVNIFDVAAGDTVMTTDGPATVTRIMAEKEPCADYPHGWRSLHLSVGGRHVGAMQGNGNRTVVRIVAPTGTPEGRRKPTASDRTASTKETEAKGTDR